MTNIHGFNTCLDSSQVKSTIGGTQNTVMNKNVFDFIELIGNRDMDKQTIIHFWFKALRDKC